MKVGHGVVPNYKISGARSGGIAEWIFSDIESIASLSAREIRLSLHGGEILLSGDEMNLLIASEKTVFVRGNLKILTFSENRDEK